MSHHPPPMKRQPTTASVKLTVYEWHLLLDELQHATRVVNRDTTVATKLWELISHQLNTK